MLEQIKGGLVVSCQALPDEPLHSSFIMGRMALAAKQGGAVGIRAQSKEDIIEIKKVVDLPVIGIVKRSYPDSDIYITATKKELEARNEVKWETYTKKIQIEARVLGDLAMNHIIPVATQYQTDLINNVYKMQSLFPADKAARLSAKNLELIEEIADRTAFIKEHVDAMIEARKVANKIESEREKAIAYHDTIVPALEEIRYHIDKLELIVDNQMWTLPKYRELLFVR